MLQQLKTDSQQTCPRCQQAFACKAGNISVCQCSTIHLSKEQSQYISRQYNACLCIHCLQALKHEYEQLVPPSIV